MTTQPPSEDFLMKEKIKLSQLYFNSDISTVEGIREYQSKHQAYIDSKYYPFRQQFEMYFSALVDTSLNINYLEKVWPKNRGFQFVIATRSLKQFYSAYDIFLDGFYEDSVSLLRSVYESFLRILFISCNPKYAYNAYKIKGQKGVKFNATNFIEQFDLDWNNYSVMSSFAHSNMFTVVEDMVKISQEGQREPITLTYEVDDNMISLVVNYFLFLLAAFLKLYSEVFVVNYDKHPSKKEINNYLKKLSEYSEAASSTLKNHSANSFWRKAGHDLDDLIRLVVSLDKDQSKAWQSEWSKIRSK